MDQQDEHIHLTEEEASGGSKEGVVRWMLFGGLALAIILLSITWIVPALMNNNSSPGEVEASTNQPGNPSNNIAPDMGNDQQPLATDKPKHKDGLDVIEN